ncbi:MAG: hypothetical protein L3J98_11805 [Gammaproteobacteria bacterium]|nr:hypothetical protein [Gammaproteobacteria bacterium]MCF6260823.1 hypothetical protein [Gammaproteobacteria bacterium]
MTYMIDAQLEQGVPSLKLIDAATGEERLHWQGDSMGSSERDWKNLFKRLVLLSCADQIGLAQRAKLPTFGDECVKCTTCVSEEKDRLVSTSVVPLRLYK